MSRTILIVDDHPSFRGMARAILESEGFDVVGEAADGASAIEAAKALKPNVVLLDVQLPDIDGFQVASQLTQWQLARDRDDLQPRRLRLRFACQAERRQGFHPQGRALGESSLRPARMRPASPRQARLHSPLSSRLVANPKQTR